MKFLPAANAAKTETAAIPEDLDPDKLMRPSSSRDTKFFWDGVNAHELRIQRRPDGTLPRRGEPGYVPPPRRPYPPQKQLVYDRRTLDRFAGLFTSPG